MNRERYSPQDLLQALAGSFSLHEALNLCLERTLEAADLDSGGIYLVNRRTGAFDLLVTRGLTEAFVRNAAHVPVGSPRWQIVMEGKVIYTVYDQIRTESTAAVVNEGLRATCTVPLLSQGRVIACFNLASHTADDFSPASRQIIEDIALQIGNVLARFIAEEELQQNIEKLRKANLALEKALLARDEFMSAMNDELRTPLTGILGLTDVLLQNIYGELTPRQAGAIQHISQSGQHLLELINEVLDFTQVQSGKIELQIVPCSMANLCNASLLAVKSKADAKGQRVKFDIDPVNLVLNADQRRLQQILVNLLDNAIKFTPPEGSIELTAAGLAAERQARLSVRDTGIGIRPEDRQRMFEPFVQLDSRLARAYKGTGLGLPLVKALAELHGGRVEVESAVGQGSKFTLVLPWEG